MTVPPGTREELKEAENLMDRTELREKAQHLWCQHCRALQKSNDTVVECWYNPLDREAPAFCAANEDAIDQLLALFDEELKEERERIFALIEKEFWCLTNVHNKRWQALKRGDVDGEG